MEMKDDTTTPDACVAEQQLHNTETWCKRGREELLRQSMHLMMTPPGDSWQECRERPRRGRTKWGLVFADHVPWAPPADGPRPEGECSPAMEHRGAWAGRGFTMACLRLDLEAGYDCGFKLSREEKEQLLAELREPPWLDPWYSIPTEYIEEDKDE